MNGSTTLRRLTSPLALVTLALVLRFAFVLSMGNRFYFADTAEYEEAALRVLAGHAPGDSSPRAPLFPIEMALGFLVGGRHNFFAVRMLQLGLAAALSLLGMRLATRLGGRAAGAITGVALAFAPTLVFTTGMLYPTMLYATLLMVAVSAAIAANDAPSARHGAGMGAALSLAYLTDPVAIAPALALFGWLVAGVRGNRRLFGTLAAAVLTALVVLGPYVAWRKAAYGNKAVFMQKAQYVLHYSRTDSLLAEGRRVQLPKGTPYTPLATGAFVKQELRILREQPAAYLHDVSGEFVHFFKAMPDRIQTQNQYNRGPVLLLGAVYFVPVLLFSIVGLLFGASPARKRWALAVLVLATAFLYSLFFTQTRYRIPVEPMMIVLAALGVVRMFPALGRAFADDEAGTSGTPRA
ncbi:MAG: glycosyltransferase family 39 protein [Candidatus Eisenbacteria bacterium]|uniref:Glycosyltransferase family 39 protein n=1 Tax=Eiseniibacteriota bacterium TaxID=2212470 RepID=A0A933W3F6_UNCEI|nr:glycosyltransferase family 39 protein [Candidatus Eisenbacteria bacterium]